MTHYVTIKIQESTFYVKEVSEILSSRMNEELIYIIMLSKTKDLLFSIILGTESIKNIIIVRSDPVQEE